MRELEEVQKNSQKGEKTQKYFKNPKFESFLFAMNKNYKQFLMGFFFLEIYFSLYEKEKKRRQSSLRGK